MSTHRSDAMTTAALRGLDPAPTTALTEEERARADATFARIVAAPTTAAPARSRSGPVRSRRRGRLLLSGGLAGAAGAAVLALLGGATAFASWTPTPEPLTGAAVKEAAATCRAALEVAEQGERVLVAERRGGWTYVLLAGPTSEGTCLMPDDLVGRPGPVDRGEEGFFGSWTADPVEAPVVPRDRIVETESMEGSVPVPGRWPFTHDEGWFSSVQGYVGGDVTGVVVHTPVGTDVEASVANGRFAAWWPSARPSSENPEVMGAWTYTVTLADGSTHDESGR